MSGKEMKKTSDELFILDGKPSLGQTVPLALQHIVAMIVGCVTPAIIVAGVAGLSEQDSIILIQAALVMSAISTLLQLFPFKFGKFGLDPVCLSSWESVLPMCLRCRQSREVLM